MELFSKEENPIDKELTLGTIDEMVAKIKYAINAIAELRVSKSKKISGKEFSFPISIDNKFDKDTYELAQDFFPVLKKTGFISVRTVRKRWSFLAGYYNKSFPLALIKTSNYEQLKESYENGISQKIKELSNNLIEDILKVFEYLGAKSIQIIDQTEFSAETNVSVPAQVPVDVNIAVNFSKYILREKHFGINPMNLKEAQKLFSLFHNMPKIYGVIKSRTESNLVSESFTEKIAFGANVKVSAQGVGVGAKFNHARNWAIHLSFYDKSELN